MKNRLIFQQLFESESSTYTYLLADAETKDAILIDSVLETVDRDLKLIEELGLKLQYVFDTHIHADHVTAAGEIRNRTMGKTVVSQNANVACMDIGIRDGDTIEFGKFQIKALATPGHTDSCMSYVCEGMVFTGDALLVRGTGRTDLQGGSSEKLYNSITTKLFQLPPETIIYPAHDYNGFTSSSIEMEMKHNPRIGKGKTKEDFVKIMSELKLTYPKKIDLALPANRACGTGSSAQNKPAQISAVPEMTVEELIPKAGRSLIIDVRTEGEYKGELGHIPGSHLITLGDELQHFLEGYSRNEEIVFVCRSGKRSEEAARLGMTLGYQKVFNLMGGMLRWNELCLPVQK